MSQRKLGRLRSLPDPRDLRIVKYFGAVSAPPDSFDLSRPVKSWGELGNDTAGDCTIAGKGHLIQCRTANAQGVEAKITTAECLKDYQRLSGYVPGDESTDTGLDERTVLKDWLKNPFVGHSLTAFAAVPIPTSSPNTIPSLHFKAALYVLGGVYLGLALPLSAEDQIENQEVWDVTSGKDAEPGSWGGHAVACVGYDSQGVTLVTWGQLQKATWSWMAKYCEEAWGVISVDWLKSGKSPEGFDLATLESDLKALKA